jgi:hypothetical protein
MAQKATPFPIEHRRWLSIAEAAGYLGICPDQFCKTIRHLLPPNDSVGAPRFDRQEIDRVMSRSTEVFDPHYIPEFIRNEPGRRNRK